VFCVCSGHVTHASICCDFVRHPTRTCGFIVTLTFSLLKDALTKYGVLYLYGGVCLLGGAFVLAVVPETQGKSLEEVEQLFVEQAQYARLEASVQKV